ncbi:MAG: hypothetical protein KDC34_17675 [Saprospiraceae bacterium]|nr:hypothetical protein [Saprospiraceae bacterium]
MKKGSIGKVVLTILVIGLLGLMILPSILVKLVDPEKAFAPPVLEKIEEPIALDFQIIDLKTDKISSIQIDSSMLEVSLILYFWAENCHPCAAELELLKKLKDQMGTDIVIYPISIDKAQERGKRFADLLTEDIPLYYWLEGDLPLNISRSKVPQAIVIGLDGSQYHQVGPANWIAPDFVKWLEQ